jgi:catechol 2,3-dioxygenase-like lactoylglutathione lyase family enzyme
MTIQRMDNVAIVVDDLDAAVAFFAELGMELEGKGQIEGLWADRTVGLDGVRSEIAMMRTPDSHGKLELTRYRTPRRPAPGRRTRRPARWARIASYSLSTTYMTPSPACAPTAPNSSARWHSTRASSCSATSAAPRASSSP